MTESGKKNHHRERLALTQGQKQTLAHFGNLFEQAGNQENEVFVRRILGAVSDEHALIPYVVEMALSRPSPFAAQVLCEMEAVADSKLLRKEIRRGCHILKQKGVAFGSVPEERRQAGVYRKPKRKEPRGYVTAIDGFGARLVALVIPRHPSGNRLLVAVLDEDSGIRDFRHTEITEAGILRFLKDSEKSEGLPFISTTAGHVCRLYREALALHERQGTTPPREFFEWKRWIEDHEPVPETAVVYKEAPAKLSKENPFYVKRGPKLFQEPIMASWLLGEEDVDPLVRKLEEAEESRLVLSAAQKERRLHELYEQAARGFFPPAKRLQLKRRLEEMSYIWRREGKEELACIALATALDLSESHQLTAETPFLTELLRLSVLLHHGSYEEEGEESYSPVSSLIL